MKVVMTPVPPTQVVVFVTSVMVHSSLSRPLLWRSSSDH